MFYLEVNDAMLTFLLLPTALSSADIISEFKKMEEDLFILLFF